MHSQVIRALNRQTVRCSHCGQLVATARFYPQQDMVLCTACEVLGRPVNLDLHTPDRPLDQEPGVPF
jgi:recombinational DNA repair protein (RecF pathway)